MEGLCYRHRSMGNPGKQRGSTWKRCKHKLSVYNTKHDGAHKRIKKKKIFWGVTLCQLMVEASCLSIDICNVLFLFRLTNHTRPSPTLWANLPFSTIATHTSYYPIMAHVGNTGRRSNYAGSWRNTFHSRRLTRVSAVASANLICFSLMYLWSPKRAHLKARWGFEWHKIYPDYQ